MYNLPNGPTLAGPDHRLLHKICAIDVFLISFSSCTENATPGSVLSS